MKTILGWAMMLLAIVSIVGALNHSWYLAIIVTMGWLGLALGMDSIRKTIDREQ